MLKPDNLLLDTNLYEMSKVDDGIQGCQHLMRHRASKQLLVASLIFGLLIVDDVRDIPYKEHRRILLM